MTHRQILATLSVGQTREFASIEDAKRTAGAIAKFYNGMRFSRVGQFITRTA